MSGGHHHDDDMSHLGEMDARVRALESLLVEKGYIDSAAIDEIIETYETRIGPQNGARVVAQAGLTWKSVSRTLREWSSSRHGVRMAGFPWQARSP